LILRDENSDPASDDQCDNGRIFYLADANFNVTAIVAESSRGEEDWAVRERYVYTPYGAATILDADFAPVPGNTSAHATTTLYTGRRLDAETGLMYYRARYYHAQLGRFINRDPIAADHNLYRYVHANPVTRTDSLGLWDQDVHFYMTYYIARALCLDLDETVANTNQSAASLIAWMCAYVDVDAKTRPVVDMTPAGARQNARYHFPHLEGKTVRPGTIYVGAEVYDAALKGDLASLGVQMHIFQDSWAHQDYSVPLGHGAEAIRDVWWLGFRDMGTSPDLPYWSQATQAKAEAMAKATYEELSYVRNCSSAGCKVKSFKDVWSRIKGTLFTEAPTDERVAGWKRLIKQDFQVDVSFNGAVGADDVWYKPFSKAAEDVYDWRNPLFGVQ
ncbi:MAG TPA: RHS repeat-associated core domain-containing protein, partial [Thermoguttaceae bacterium]|nr:RHS repeat-associated core domain-containing protein [Thermoguttaceae bacterium]